MLTREIKQKPPVANDKLQNELFNAAAHEIRTPLCVIKNIISNALAGALGELPHKLKENLLMADKEIHRIANTINNLLDVAEESHEDKSVPPPYRFAIQSVANKTIKQLEAAARAKNLVLMTKWPKEELIVEGDYERIAKAMSNILFVAIESTPEGGTVAFRIKNLEDAVGVEIEDNGTGIETDPVGDVFVSFLKIEKLLGKMTRNTVLDFALAKKIIENHGGKIWAKNNLGKGKVFCFTFPNKTILPKTQILLAGQCRIENNRL